MGGGNTEAYIKKADELNISDCVSFPGWISGAEKENLLRNATVFILPSYNEGLPVSMLEAMSYGLACVVTDVGGIPSVINNGENGLLIEPGNIEMLTNTICMLLDDQQRIKEIGEHAYNTIVNEFDIKKNLKDLISIYFKLAG